MNAIVAQWRSRSEAERTRLTAAATVIAIVLLVTLAWLPMQRATTRLESELPGLRAAAATMKRQADQVAALRAAPALNAAAAQPLASLAGSGPLALVGAQVTALDERRLRLIANDVAWGALLDWIANAKAAHGLDVSLARIDALAMAGHVKADLTLERP